MNLSLSQELRSFVASTLSSARHAARYSLQEASHLLDIDETRLKNYERGEESPPGYEVAKIIRLYRINPIPFFQTIQEKVSNYSHKT